MKKNLRKTKNAFSKKSTSKSMLLTVFLFSFFTVKQLHAQAPAVGSWTAVSAAAPDPNLGEMLLLSDGTVLCKTSSGGTDGYGNTWDKLTPDTLGSYANGTWSTIAPMHSTRLYFSSQILKDGRVYIAGGEYGTGTSKGEVYDPLTNTWKATPNAPSPIYDGNSEILDNGTVLQAYQGSQVITQIYDPVANTYSAGPNVHGSYDESAWVKLPDGSILYVDINSTSSERYIPSQNKWVVDATVPVSLYDPYGEEAGAGFLLPDGRAFFLGSPGHTAYYTPSGTTAPGTWAAGPDIPSSQGTPDAAAAMMVNGKILCAVSPVPTSANHFPSPTAFYEFDYLTNTFTAVNAPGGGKKISGAASYITNLLDLPDGTVLYGQQGLSQYYIYKPAGKIVASGKPKLKGPIHKNTDGSYRIKGTLFNGISEGAAYGDDWQMATNYPLVRLTSATGGVYYGRTFNWNHTGVQTGTLADTAYFTLPAGIPAGTYSVVVTVNGFSSNALSLAVTSGLVGSESDKILTTSAAFPSTTTMLYPNPAHNQTTLEFNLAQASRININVFDVNGKIVKTVMNDNLEKGQHSLQINTSQLSRGIYFVEIVNGNNVKTEQLIVQ